MIDFLIISTRSPKKDVIEIYPKFIIKKSSDLMIRGSDFYAIWVEDKNLWSTDEQDALQIIDRELDRYAKKKFDHYDGTVRVMHLWDAETGMIDKWHKYCQKQMRDNFHMLDEKLIFSNSSISRDDYASKKLSYPLEKSSINAYDKLMSTLYSIEERHKLEWAIGAIVSGDSKTIQKFIVLYGAAGTGKSTVLNIIELLFDGYYSVFDAKALGSANSTFALESFKTNPLVAIQHDGDLSRIEDNTRLNSLVSHELMTVNEKFKSAYSSRFKSFLFMGTNKPVKITDARSGLIRRLIDVTPSGNKLPPKEYSRLFEQIKFELGGIASHCLEVYSENTRYYDDYVPLSMMSATNDFYNFIYDSYYIFEEEDGVSLKSAWEMYKEYCDEAKVGYPYPKRIFKEELKNYFKEYKDRFTLEDGIRVRNYYMGFKKDKIDGSEVIGDTNKTEESKTWLEFKEQDSIFDKEFSDCYAQYAIVEGTPEKKWSKCKTKLSDLDTHKLHYVQLPSVQHVIVDFDIPDESGNKCLKKNIDAASKFPPTYAELSKSGEGIHLHYIYLGDTSMLNRVYGEHIEVKVFNGASSLRRKLTKCNDLPIATINSGLPLKGEKKLINFDAVKSERSLRALIERNLRKEIHPGTKPSIDFIYKILEDAYSGELKYDVSDMYNDILAFGANSTNNSNYCIKLVSRMKFKSEEPSEPIQDDKAFLVFYDIEVFPNLFLVNYKIAGEGKPIVRLINPRPIDIEELMRFRLVGFNCRQYDNHMIYACMMGYTNEQLFNLSQKLVSKDKDISRQAKFGEAYNISYTDILDFCSKKQSLKKWEIELGIHHLELGLPWDQPVPEEMWTKVAEYCDNDVIATEAVFNARQADFIAREVLAEVAGMTVNDTTNTLTTKIIFGNNRHPQDQFNYRDMGMVSYEDTVISGFDDYTRFNKEGQPVFPGYEYNFGKSIYRGEEVGEGGYVYAEAGMYGNVALLDVASMHPSSIIAEVLFGTKYTRRFNDIVNARLAIKHKDFETAKQMLDGALAKYLTDEESAGMLAQALKIAINSVYGLTKARFDHPFRDPRNVDNIVAKRGALFMVNLKYEVQSRGFTVAHIKTDSIKIPDATPEIIQFVMDYGKMYGYTFEHEATYDRMCLVNDAVYVAKYKDDQWCKDFYGYVPEKNAKSPNKWTPTGTQFQVPYVFKKLFTKEDIVFEDLCETKSVKQGSIYINMNENLPDSIAEKMELEKYKNLLKKGNYAKYSKEDLENSIQTLEDIIAERQNYIFVGRVGQFTPVKSGCGGGILCRYDNDKYYALSGTKGYRWLESEIVRQLQKERDVDFSYYDKLVNDAVDAISFHGNLEWFVSDDPYISPDYDKFGRPVYLGSEHLGQLTPLS